ncbi:hypothetical protein PC9H_006713 [Pleurotus ostreatus]|uniref:Uncharacterized protein n=1 Tax=Pleurotus ostreatus TaxID=5322 RepID=A0A8H7DT98_PLEOS|nr:uncharacterized protein PC9H_006713 [Pleurotus ostreatus]KAF7430998.1 hypothetical protein PC9H_006713 [Pleurotus ostreatus]KAJ8695382.1 hypothetical protein PTI98_007985 [Pleurotus ostreatus]
MGRPRLYHTPEEQKKAHKRKHRNYYKRHRETILERSRNQYAERVSRTHAPFEAATPDNNDQSVDDVATVCLLQLTEIKDHFTTLVGTDNTEFMLLICQSSLAEESLHPIESVTAQLEEIIDPADGLVEVLLELELAGRQPDLHEPTTKGPMARKAKPSHSTRVLSDDEIAFLKTWAPEYKKANAAKGEELQGFLARFWMVWFDRWPLANDIEDKDLRDDKIYLEWRKGKYQARVLKELKWLSWSLKRR